jgi:uncharacterized protein
LGAVEQAVIERVQQKFQELNTIPCTRCNYCMPCPNGVNIPQNLNIYNEGFAYEDMKAARSSYSTFGHFAGEKALASSCTQCKVCETKCPQKIAISEWIPKVHALLGVEPAAEVEKEQSK